MNFITSLFFSLMFLLGGTGYSQNIENRFKHITPSNGLSQGNVFSILKDKQGFMWFGTADGLNKFDGYTFTTYKNNPSNPNSISDNFIQSIIEDGDKYLWIATYGGGLELYDKELDTFQHHQHSPNNPSSLPTNFLVKVFKDSKGVLWVGTWGGGLCMYDKENKQFISYKHDKLDKNSISNNFLSDITEDKEGNLWIGTEHGGLNMFNRENKKFTHYRYAPNGKSVANDHIRSLLCDSKGNLWVGTDNGLNHYEVATQTFTTFRHNPNNNNSISLNLVRSLEEDENGQIWIGTENGGISIYNPIKKTFLHLKNDENDSFSLNDNSIYFIYDDNEGSMWVGTYSGGINYFNKNSKKFNLSNKFVNKNSISNNKVLSFLEDKEGNLWIATDGGGLNKLDRKTGAFTYYQHNPNDPNSLSGDHVLSILEDGAENFWLGTWSAGLNYFNRKENTFTHFMHIPGNTASMSNNNPWSLLIDSNDNLWVCTIFGGLNKYDPKKKEFKNYLNDEKNPNSISVNNIHHIIEDSKKNIWVGTAGGGIALYKPEIDGFIHHKNNKQSSNSLSSNNVNYIFEDSKGNLWIGTKSGLNRYNPGSNDFDVFLEKDGLPNNVINGILEDNKGFLWLSTNKGISCFEPTKKAFRNYDVQDGLQGNEFFHGSCYKTRDGEMFFGGTNGYNSFYPDSISSNSNKPPVVITHFQIFNKPVEPGKEGSPLSKHINITEKIILSHKESVFSFEFSALNYVNSEKNQYAYKLEGFDKEWNYVGTQRKATYTNLDPGTYTFKVKATNNDNIWNEEGKALSIIITPPYWQTWWFRILFIFTVMGVAITWYTSRVNSIKKQQVVLEKKVDLRTSELSKANNELIKQQKEILSQREKIEDLYEDIKGSIRAAESIQESILPSKDIINQYLPGFFAFYKPKDIVSGDFYWFAEKNDKIILAAIDCTGHGVSGALMSIKGHYLLNQILNSIEDIEAGKILQQLHLEIIKKLNKGDCEQSEGMDISLCIIDKDLKKMQFAGAQSPVYILKEGVLHEIKGDKCSIGAVSKFMVDRFKTHVIELQEGNMVYLFSDGYADQFGGPGGDEKFMYYRFRKLLKKIAKQDVNTQHKLLDENLSSWMGEREQLDDVMVLGFKI